MSEPGPSGMAKRLEKAEDLVEQLQRMVDAQAARICELQLVDGDVLTPSETDTDPLTSASEICDAAHRGDVDRIRQLIEMGCSIDQGDYDRRTAMHLAASEGLLQVVRFLVNEANADVNPTDRWGGTPLDDAVRSKHDDVVALLKASGGTRGKAYSASRANAPTASRGEGNVKWTSELCDLAAEGNVARLRTLLSDAPAQGFSVSDGDYDHRTGLHLAASEGHLGAVRFLVEERRDASPRSVVPWPSPRGHHAPRCVYPNGRRAPM